MFISAGCSKDKANQLIKTILTDVSYFIDKNERFKKNKDKYKDITKEDSLIICIYTYEFYSPDDIYNTYSILNSNMASNNRKQGIKNVSKYLFLLLTSLRKLERYYPTKTLYRCISVLVKLDYDSFNPKFVPYLEGKEKTFWAFTSTSPNIKKCYEFLGTNNKSGTIFSIKGDIYGYDISLFNICGEEEILLEPERKYVIEESLPEINNIIYVRCLIKETPVVLYDLLANNDDIQDIFESKEFYDLNLDQFIEKFKSHKYFEKLKNLKKFYICVQSKYLSDSKHK